MNEFAFSEADNQSYEISESEIQVALNENQNTESQSVLLEVTSGSASGYKDVTRDN